MIRRLVEALLLMLSAGAMIGLVGPVLRGLWSGDSRDLAGFLLSIVPLFLVPLLLIRFGHFMLIKNLSKAVLLLLSMSTLITLIRPLFQIDTLVLIFVFSLLITYCLMVWIVSSKPRVRHSIGTDNAAPRLNQMRKPTIIFRDVGGLDGAKEQIRRLIQTRLGGKHYRRYGVVQNGILLHGPRGSGKTFLAEATAGEFNLHYFYVSPNSLIECWVGNTDANIRNTFATAMSKRPVLLFIDEIDTLGSARQSTSNDYGGGRTFYNNQVTQLMQSIDQYRSTPGFVLMAATNLLDGLDPALVREGRFDLKVRVDLPDQPARVKILESQLFKKPWKRFSLEAFAAKTPGYSAARLQALVDRAAAIAAEHRRRIEARDLSQALAGMGGEDRPLFQPVEWKDVILEAEVEQDLEDLVDLLNEPANPWRVRPPTGVLLIGPPGTGKSLVARLIATETRRSFYPITPSEILGGNVGESVKKLTALFERAKENSPSIIFLDELDGLMPSAQGGLLSQHDIQLVEQFLIETSKLMIEQNVLLVGASNLLERIDPRVLRGGRFSEKIHLSLPSQPLRERLLVKLLDGMPLDPSTSVESLATLAKGLSSADIQAVCETAKRFAYRRIRDDKSIAPTLIQEDFQRAIERVRVDVQPLV